MHGDDGQANFILVFSYMISRSGVHVAFVVTFLLRIPFEEKCCRESWPGIVYLCYIINA